MGLPEGRQHLLGRSLVVGVDLAGRRSRGLLELLYGRQPGRVADVLDVLVLGQRTLGVAGDWTTVGVDSDDHGTHEVRSGVRVRGVGVVVAGYRLRGQLVVTDSCKL